MAVRGVVSLCGAIVALAGIAAPATAGEFRQSYDQCYRCTRDAIYELVNDIALAEANPDVDDGIKGPQITADRAEIHRSRATLGPPLRRYATPCCYSRRPLYIR